MLMDDPISPILVMPKLLGASFGHFWTAFSTFYAYLRTVNFPLILHILRLNSPLPTPSFQAILGPWCQLC